MEPMNLILGNFISSSGVTITAPIISFNWTMVMVLITLLVLFLILKKQFFEKVHNFMKEREDSLQSSFDSAEMSNKAAEAKLEEYEKKIALAETEGKEIVMVAKAKADARAKEILDEANEKATKIILNAEDEIERLKRKSVEEMKNEISMLAILAAEAIVKEELKNPANQNRIVDQVIEEVGNAKWKS